MNRVTGRPGLISKTYKIREEVVDKILEIAQELDVSEAAVVRMALTEYFKEPKLYGMGFGNTPKTLPKENN